MTPDEIELERARLAAIAECDRTKAKTLQWVRECNIDAMAYGIWINKETDKLREKGDPLWMVYSFAREYLAGLLLQVEQERIDRERGDSDETP